MNWIMLKQVALFQYKNSKLIDFDTQVENGSM